MRLQKVSITVENPRFNSENPNIHEMDYTYLVKINDKDYKESGVIKNEGCGTGFYHKDTPPITRQLEKDYPDFFIEDEYDSRGIIEAIEELKFKTLDFNMTDWENLDDIQEGRND